MLISRRKPLGVVLFVLICMLLIPGTVRAQETVSLVVENHDQPLDIQTLMADGKLFVPLRQVWESLGYSVRWDAQTNTAYLSGENKSAGVSPQDIMTVKNNAVYRIAAVSKEGYEFRTGSGFLVSSDGKILTNYHVIRGASYLKVYYDDDTSVVVTNVLAYDRERDFALLSLPGARFPQPLEVGSSADVKIGEKVVVVGSPLGYLNTVSDGLLSGITEIGGQEYFLISAPISPGSSGGPLFDSDGKVIGIVTAKLTGAESINLALPIDEIKAVLEEKSQPQTLDKLSRETDQNPVTADELASYLYDRYGVFSQGEYKIILQGLDVRVMNNQTLGVTITLDDEGYVEWLNLQAVKPELLSAWMKAIRTETERLYPRYNYLGLVAYVQPVNSYPPYYITLPVYTLNDIAGIETEKFQ